MARLEFFFDVSSPWTYLAFHNVQPLAAELGVPIDWKPILVGGVFNAVNQSVYESRANPVMVKARWHKKSMMDWARLAGLKITFPPAVFPVNSVKVMRACCGLLEEEGSAAMVRFARAAFEAYWGDDADISKDDVVAAVARAAGLDPDAVLASANAQKNKDALRANTDDVIARGGFGSPTMFVDGADMYFGNDVLPLVRAALMRA
jgi:2-hydroxychromene-2-carboxylate isomerase